MRRPNLFVLLLCRFQTLLELVNASARIHEFLLARKEGMALGADFNTHITGSGLGHHLCAASTTDGNGFVFRMDSFLHDLLPLFPNSLKCVP